MEKKTILQLLKNSKHSSIASLITNFQNIYPRSYFYKPVGIEIEVTNNCNLKCEGCPVVWDQKEKINEILKADDYINTLKNLSDTGIFAYSLTGGETFLNFETITKIINSVHDLDIYKLNTNGSFFNSPITTKDYLERLEDAGFVTKNKYIKPVLVLSIGQQTQAGVPLENAVHLIKQFNEKFNDNAILALNITGKNMNLTQKIYGDLVKLYASKTSEILNESLAVVRFFSLNNINTLNRLGLTTGNKMKVLDLLASYTRKHLSRGCFNINIKNINDSKKSETLIPRCLLKPNGNLYSCPGFNYVLPLGNVLKDSPKKLLKDANKNIYLKTIFKENLEGLYKMALKSIPDLKYLKLEEEYEPCDLCHFIINAINVHNADKRITI